MTKRKEKCQPVIIEGRKKEPFDKNLDFDETVSLE